MERDTDRQTDQYLYNKISNFYIQPEEEYLDDSLPPYPELDDMQRIHKEKLTIITI